MASAIKGSVVSALESDNFQASQISKEKLNLRKIGEKGKEAFLLHNVLNLEECQKLIELAESYGFQPAMINFGDGKAILDPEYRGGFRVMIDDHKFAKTLFQRIENFLPRVFPAINKEYEWKLLEINERLRFLRYGKNDQFKSHQDGSYRRIPGQEETFVTLQIYLNDEFEGGSTTFLEHHTGEAGNTVPVQPQPGMILVFQHNILHEGSQVISGTKYTIRMDVLYKLTSKDSSSNQIRFWNWITGN